MLQTRVQFPAAPSGGQQPSVTPAPWDLTLLSPQGICTHINIPACRNTHKDYKNKSLLYKDLTFYNLKSIVSKARATMLSLWFFSANSLLSKPLFGILSIIKGDTSLFFEAVLHSANGLVIHSQVLWARWCEDNRSQILCILINIQKTNHRPYYHTVSDSRISSKVTAEIGN